MKLKGKRDCSSHNVDTEGGKLLKDAKFPRESLPIPPWTPSHQWFENTPLNVGSRCKNEHAGGTCGGDTAEDRR